MKKKLLALLLAGVLLVGSAGAAFTATRTYTPGQFTDVAANVWYAASVQKVYELGLMSGSSATTFNPNGMFTVGEALTVAGRMHSLAHGGNGVLPAATGAWYQGAVNYCLQNKLITADQFDSYTRSATRSEMAGVIRAALPDDQWKAINSVSALPDVNMGNEYAQAIFDLYNAGVFTGSDEYGMFQPYAYITRAEVAAIVARCADPSQRKTLSLTPLSQRQAPELVGGYQSNVKMSNGRLAYKDPNTGKWGYLDGKGNAVIPAQYDKVEAFENGYAKVQKNGNWGLINTSGVAVLPLKYSNISKLSDGAYTCTAHSKKKGEMFYLEPVDLFVNGRIVTKETDAHKGIGGLGDGLYRFDSYFNRSGVIDANGKVVLPCQFWDIQWNGVYFKCNTKTASFQSNQYDIYDRNGVKLMSGLDDVTMAKNNPLLVVKEGEKYAVAVGSKKITEAVYDYVWLIENSNFARVEYGDLTGLVGVAGELIAPGKYLSYSFNGDYFAAYQNSKDGQPCEVVIGDATGVLYRADYNSSIDTYTFDLTVYGDKGPFYVQTYGRYSTYRGVFFHKDGTSQAVHYDSGCFTWSDEDGEYLMTKTGEVFGPRGEYSYSHYYWDDGSYGIWNETGELSGPIYDSQEEALKAYDSSKPMNRRYEIRKNNAGKPIVAYGNAVDGWTNVIEYYKNNMYYDEIQELGEGYYACRFNTTWYLVHA